CRPSWPRPNFHVRRQGRHNTLDFLRKSCAKGRASAPFGIPPNKTGCIFPPREHAAILLSAARFSVCV
ncbi:MAG: hypothetical protein ACK5MN_12975, partial [Lachnospiraceae bacterium]